MTKKRRVNFLVILAAPVFLFALSLVVALRDFLHPALSTVITLLTAGILIFVVIKALTLLKRVSAQEAARLLDNSLSAKDRFLTLATFTDSTPPAQSLESHKQSLEAIAKQGNKLAKSYTPSEELPITLENPAKYSAYLSPLLLLAIIAIFWLAPSGTYSSALEMSKISSEHIDELRDIANNNNSLPDDLTDNLSTLADSIEEEGILSDEVLNQVENLLDNLDKIEGAQNSQLDFEHLRKTSEEKKSDAKKDKTPPQQQDSKDNSQASEKPKQQQTQQQNQSDTSKQQESPKSAESGKQSKSTGDSKGDKADQSGKSKSKENDSKKDTTGVGKGKGDGSGANDDKTKGGSPKAGNDDNGAKDGEAQNKGPNSKSDSKTDSKTKSSAKQQPQDGTGEQQKNDKGKDGSKQAKSDKLQQVSQKLKQIQDRSKKHSKGTKEQEFPDKGETQQQKNTKGQNAKDQKGAKAKHKQEAKPENGSAKKGANDKNDPAKSPSKAGKNKQKQQEKGTGQAKTTPKDKQSTNSKTKNSQGSEGNDKNTKKVLRPSKQARRFGPFEGGDSSELDTSNATKTKVTLPPDENIIVRHLGGVDPKLYKNKPGTEAKTKLGAKDFKKQQAQVGKLNQPIPVEYRDLLR